MSLEGVHCFVVQYSQPPEPLPSLDRPVWVEIYDLIVFNNHQTKKNNN